ncbi:MAG: D-alanine--D-alanine ligase [Gemmatimonadota bacterium]
MSTGDSLRVAVFLGGDSVERDVSLASGREVISALRERGHRVVGVDPARGVLGPTEETALSAEVSALPPAEVAPPERPALTDVLRSEPVRGADVVFVALHGGAGEDGRLQAMLELEGIRYTGSGPLGCALAMDKDIAKHLMRAAGVPTADWLMAPASTEEVADRLGFPVIVKASKQGSTVGLSLVREPGELPAAIELGYRHDDEVMIERFVPGRELTVAVVGDETFPPGEIISQHEIFDYECKYQPGMAEEVFPAALTDREARGVSALALATHRALKLGGYSRVDFRMDPAGIMWCLEANTAPGMTSASLLPKAGQAAGVSFPALCDRICRLALGS